MKHYLLVLISLLFSNSAFAAIALTPPANRTPVNVVAVACTTAPVGVIEGYRPKLAAGGYGFCEPTLCDVNAGYREEVVNGKCQKETALAPNWFTKAQSVQTAVLNINLVAELSSPRVVSYPILVCPSTTSADAVAGLDYTLPVDPKAVFTASSQLSATVVLKILKPAESRPIRQIILGLGPSCSDASTKKISITLAAYGTSVPKVTMVFTPSSVEGGKSAKVKAVAERVISNTFETKIKANIGSTAVEFIIPKNSAVSQEFQVDTTVAQIGTTIPATVTSAPTSVDVKAANSSLAVTDQLATKVTIGEATVNAGQIANIPVTFDFVMSVNAATSLSFKVGTQTVTASLPANQKSLTLSYQTSDRDGGKTLPITLTGTALEVIPGSVKINFTTPQPAPGVDTPATMEIKNGYVIKSSTIVNDLIKQNGYIGSGSIIYLGQ